MFDSWGRNDGRPLRSGLGQLYLAHDFEGVQNLYDKDYEQTLVVEE